MTNNKQQTAVEWLAEKTFNQIELLKHSCINEEQFLNNMLIFREQAKEIECVLLCAKEQRSIELPSDEEIKIMMELDGMEFDEFDPYDVSYLGGATWMRNKIQGGEQ